MKFLITGGAGFIGSALVRYLIQTTEHSVLNVDCLTYAGHLESLKEIEKNDRYVFKKMSICDYQSMKMLFDTYQPDVIMHLAAESHVDRSITASKSFIETNIVGTYVLLEVSRYYWQAASDEKRKVFRFHHISTDEVFGDLGSSGLLFTEETSYSPSSPYSASKASSDHLVRAWGRTYGLPILITNCSNNYGPYQYPEKLIPLMILNGLNKKPLPVYGEGAQIRDWLYVEDHVRALYQVIKNGVLGETYNIGGHCEKRNLDVVYLICDILDELGASQRLGSHRNLITFVQDRPGHDERYAIDASKIDKDLGWKPIENFESGLRKTVHWYLDHLDWCKSVSIKGS